MAAPAPRVIEQAAVGFERGADDYERGRPGYPPEAIRRIGSELSIGPGQTIVDLAAGTGKLTRELTALGADVVAIEPVAGMRAQLERIVTGATVLDGTAEQIPLADGIAQAVFVAQAFHWFRVPEAAAEIARVLDHNGALVIVRNQEDTSAAAPALAEALALVRNRIEHEHSHRHRTWRAELDATGVFEPFTEWTVRNDFDQTIELLRHRIASRSYIATMDDADRARLLDDMQAVLERSGIAPGEPFTVPAVTRVIWARPNPRPTGKRRAGAASAR